MTAIAGSVSRSATRRGAGIFSLRGLVWVLHIAVTFLAVFSISTNRFDLWIDLRMLGGLGMVVTKIVWVGTVLLIPWCAGPRMAGWRKPVWVNAGFSVGWAQALLWPTYFVIACLVANTVYYYQLLQSGVIETTYPIPITLVAAVILGAWAIGIREWARRKGAVPREAAGRRAQVASGIFAIGLGLALAEFFLLHMYFRRPTEPVDLAVVLGNRVMPDGTASGVLRDRTMAAVELYKRGLARHLFLSGAVLRGENGGAMRNEPVAMMGVCLENGVPESAITLDPYGVNTKATAFNAAEYMRARGLTTVAGCSDDYHLFRIAQSFRVAGLEAYTVPGVRRAWECAELPVVVRETLANCVYQIDKGYHDPKEVDMKLDSPRVVVRKSANVLEIYAEKFGEQTLVKCYACITGGNAGDKEVEGDRRTPVGKFHVVFKNKDSKFHLSLGLDYPSAEDAERGLKAKLISRAEYEGILAALKSDLRLPENQKKLWYTALGGEIFIHGHAEGRTGTAGCIAVSNPDIDEIYAALPEGTVVEILP